MEVDSGDIKAWLRRLGRTAAAAAIWALCLADWNAASAGQAGAAFVTIAQAQEIRPSVSQEPAVPPAVSVATETVDNPYGFKALWEVGDYVTRGTLLVLLIMSMGSWYILFTKLYDLHRFSRHARGANGVLRRAVSVRQGVTELHAESPFRYVGMQALDAVDYHSRVRAPQSNSTDILALSIQRALEQVQSRLQDGLSFLATVGSTSPFVGLFGTVWGIYHALTAIGIAGQASIDKVAGPVGEALIMTAIGLAVAVPAVIAYNWLVRRNKRAMEEMRAFATELQLALMSGSASPEGVVTPLPAAPRAKER